MSGFGAPLCTAIPLMLAWRLSRGATLISSSCSACLNVAALQACEEEGGATEGEMAGVVPKDRTAEACKRSRHRCRVAGSEREAVCYGGMLSARQVRGAARRRQAMRGAQQCAVRAAAVGGKMAYNREAAGIWCCVPG